ncbi:ATP-binding protein [Undibacterium sp. Di26W]|uniref:ATP-binding protein n=1 Tax=Undibacterium sp. Di26W TaxID=3413035 RepID=UPI003BF3DA0D
MNLRQSLFHKYLSVLSAMVCGTLLLASMAQIALSVYQQRQRTDELLVAESRLATVQIQSFLSSIVASMNWVLDYDQPGAQLKLGEVRDEGHRLLRKTPSLTQLRYVDAHACVLLELSRIQVDRSLSCGDTPLSPQERSLLAQAHRDKVAYGPVLFRDGSVPYVEVAVAARGRGGALMAQIDLRQIHATITGVRVGSTGYAYIVDRDWQLVAHPDNSLVLRHMDLRQSSAVAAALGSAKTPLLTRDIDTRYVLSAAATVPGPNWWVFVHLPVQEALQPILTSLWVTLLVILLAMLVAIAASYYLAQRMTKPILAVRTGAARMGAGDLQARISVTTGDEVELLAQEFNRMAATLGESHAQLEEKVRQRTQALEQAGEQVRTQAGELASVNAELSVRLDELALRKDEAERASAAKTRFLAAASHDLLQPMHAVGLMVGILRQNIRYPDVSRIVMKVESAVQGMEALFASLLDISKLDSQSIKVDVQPVEMASLLGFIDLNYQPIALEKKIALRIARSRYVVRTDPAILERIVGNLVSNAIRYTRSGKVLVGCRRKGDMVHLLVYDTGIGIPKQCQEHIFDEFYQVDSAADAHGKGLGLGLSIVHRSAALLGHALYVQSTPGAGSVFGIALPLVRHAASRKALQLVADVVHDALQGAFIVIVDDDHNAIEATEQLFQMAGSHVVTGASTESVLHLLESHLRVPDLIVTDLRLRPGDSGLQLIAALRADSEQLIPALIVTGEGHPPGQEMLPQNCRLVRKPVGPERLLELCAQMLSAPAAAQNLNPVSPPRSPPGCAS